MSTDKTTKESAAFNIEIFVYYIVNAFGQAYTTFVGQNYEADKPERCLKATMLALIQDLIFTAFQFSQDFNVLMPAYPLSWIVTATALVVSYFWLKKSSVKSKYLTYSGF